MFKLTVEDVDNIPSKTKLKDCFFEKFYNKDKIKKTQIITSDVEQELKLTAMHFEAKTQDHIKTIDWVFKTQQKVDKGKYNTTFR